MGKLIRVFNHKKGLINLQHIPHMIVEMMPVELHFKKDGATDETPSFAMVLQRGDAYVYGQLSLHTLKEALAELGYDVVKSEKKSLISLRENKN